MFHREGLKIFYEALGKKIFFSLKLSRVIMSIMGKKNYSLLFFASIDSFFIKKNSFEEFFYYRRLFFIVEEYFFILEDYFILSNSISIKILFYRRLKILFLEEFIKKCSRRLRSLLLYSIEY